ncbi:transposase IS4 family protein [Thermosediminibacter oceani DSM 16646]|uniref:Transposase IS4 family protein n=2 Tax=Thermosediminibacter TaxID=291988 RepID=D9RYD0_THEOJ|nr:transposase IS4 family protein [Thermosediminibacter oceani DSM 16646]ADL08374.1 transposase IS4 family protein [Thermosediminibacter oceani DSM 16646]ADL08716.1 transposase IS4 family protein [Thermosediminibacter oceani DSM 16646]
MWGDEMLTKKNREIIEQVELVSIDSLVPQDHLLRAVEESIDFNFIYDEVKDLYSENTGRPSIDPVVLIKLLMLQALYGIRSMRQTIREVEVNVAYRWFLGYGLQEKIPHFSTFGKNYERRFKESDLFEKIFERVLMEAIECGFVKTDAVFIDATHIKASANKNKYIEKVAKQRTQKYKKELLKEINAEREANGKKPFEEEDDDDDNNKGENSSKKVRVSTTDPESGMFQKGEKERCFAYTASVACDRNNFVLGVKIAPGNVHDSQVFSDLFQEVNDKFSKIEAVVVDAGYKTPGICREIIEAGALPVMPYKRPMTKDGYFKKREYVYDEYYDCYICPNNQILEYSTTNRAGYREYRSNPQICCKCPMRLQCTKSKNYTKIITRHIWEHYIEIAEDIRHTQWGKELYKMRGQTIERVFADAKEKHGMRYTNLRGLRKVGHYLTLLFACMNLKKLALWKKRRGTFPPTVPALHSFFLKIFFAFNKKPLLGYAS